MSKPPLPKNPVPLKLPGRAIVPSMRAEEPDERVPSLRNLILAGVCVVTLGFGGFGAWAVTARLDNAAVANGTVVVDSKRKTVSHLEGGILKMLLKSEGDRVAQDEPLLQMEDARARAELQQLHGKRVGFEAKLARPNMVRNVLMSQSAFTKLVGLKRMKSPRNSKSLRD